MIGIAVVPLLLHIRFRKKVIQVIPSLNLFMLNNRRRRRFWLENLFLLLSRILLLASVALLLSQPFWLTLEHHPFYDMMGGIQEGPSVALLIDDRVDSAHRDQEGSRLERSVAWADQQLATLPDSSRVLLGDMSMGQVSRWLSPEEARSRLKLMDPSLEREGQAHKGLQALYEKMRGQWGTLLVAGPLDAQTWHGSSEELRMPAHLPIPFFDTRETITPVYLDDIEETRGEVRDGVVELNVMVRGSDENLLKASIQLEQNGVIQQTRALEDVRGGVGRTRLRVPMLDEVSAVKLSLIPPGSKMKLPWDDAYFVVEARERKVSQRWVLLGRGDEPEVDEKLLMSIVQIFRNQQPFERFDRFGEDPSSFGEASRILLMGTDGIDARLEAWIRERLKNGSQVICFPASDGGGEGPVPDMLPSYGAWAQKGPSFWLPITLGVGLEHADLESLVASGVDRMGGSTLVDVKWPHHARNLLLGQRAEPVLSRLRVGAWGWVDAFSIPLLDEPDSVIYHPMFPLLIGQMLQEKSTARRSRGSSAWFGESIRSDDFLGEVLFNGEHVLPSGLRQPMILEPGATSWVLPLEKGIHRFEGEVVEVLSAVNERRPQVTTPMEKQDWEERYPLFSIRSFDADRTLVEEDFVYLTDDTDSLQRHQYDFSILAAFAALAVLVLEMAFTLLAWLRWKKGFQ